MNRIVEGWGWKGDTFTKAMSEIKNCSVHLGVNYTAKELANRVIVIGEVKLVKTNAKP